MKVALCFIINYKHELHKEEVWKDWIEPIKHLFNIYFHYENKNKIRSPWILKHCIPPQLVAPTSYYHVVPGYMSILNYAFQDDLNNKWFCLLTESCVPIISPFTFLQMFNDHYQASIFSWRKAYWNIDIHTRANLRYLKSEYHLSNEPWFVLSRDHVHKSLIFLVKKNDVYKNVCNGGLANESIFAIILQTFNELNNEDKLINEISTITDWNRMANVTSPHLFTFGDEADIQVINNLLEKNKYSLFLRKVGKEFPTSVLEHFIYKKEKSKIYLKTHNYASLKKKSSFDKILQLAIFFGIWIGISFLLLIIIYFSTSIVVHILYMLQM